MKRWQIRFVQCFIIVFRSYNWRVCFGLFAVDYYVFDVLVLKYIDKIPIFCYLIPTYYRQLLAQIYRSQCKICHQIQQTEPQISTSHKNKILISLLTLTRHKNNNNLYRMNPLLFVLLTFLLVSLSKSILDREYYNALRNKLMIVVGVPISAGPDEIKQAYRKLSRKYHPDRNPNSRKKFQKINVAYETLSNQQKKYLYDRLGRQKMDDPNIQQEKNVALMKGSNIEIKLTLTLQNLYSGKQITGTIYKKTVCPHCLGSGAQNEYDVVRCSDCQGQGRTTKRVHVGGGYYNMMTQTCHRCSGKGKIIGRKCSTCEGNRIISGNQDFNVTIVPGMFDNEVIKYTNMGDQIDEGAPGDLFVRIIQARHSRFIRNGHDLHTEIVISLREALFGFKRTIKQLDDRDLQINQETITQPGQYIVIENEGMPIRDTTEKGHMYVKVLVAIPQYSPQNLAKLESLLNQIEQ